MSRKYVRNCPPQRAPWIEESGEPQCVVSARAMYGRVEYCVKWRGSDGRTNYAWVPLVSLDCPQLVAEYEMEQEMDRRKEIKKQRRINNLEETFAREDNLRKRMRSEDTSTRIRPRTRNCASKNEGETFFKTSAQLSRWEEAITGPNGFAHVLKPAKILAITKRGDGRRKFIMKWMDTNRIGVVSAQEANDICPQLVLDYYEKMLHWRD